MTPAGRSVAGDGNPAALGFLGDLLPVVLFACGPFFAVRGAICARRISMDLPVALGMLITFVVSSWAPSIRQGRSARGLFDSLTMFVFFLLSGRWLELRLRDRTAGALEAVMNRLPDSVERRLPGGWERVTVRRLRPAMWCGCWRERLSRPTGSWCAARPMPMRRC
jgi:cation transport ATPase